MLWGDIEKGVGVVRDKDLKMRMAKPAHTRWSGGRGYLRRGK